MKALILAAGFGSRLAPFTSDRPKALVAVNGKPILFKQIESLYENGVEDITVVSGYRADALEKAVRSIWRDVKILPSRDYASTNNMYSAYLGIRAMFPDLEPKPFVMMNADVFFDASVLAALLRFPSPNAVVVDFGRYLEESMKVTESGGRLRAISKEIRAAEALGCSIDVYKFGDDGAKAFYKKSCGYIEDRGERNLWSEVALNDAFADAPFLACPLCGRWVEIDDLADLSAAEALFRTP